MVDDYFSADDGAYAAYQAELELQEWIESPEFADWFNVIAVEEIVVPHEVFQEICGE